MVHGFASPLNVPAPPEGFETAWARFLPEMLESYKEPEIASCWNKGLESVVSP